MLEVLLGHFSRTVCLCVLPCGFSVAFKLVRRSVALKWEILLLMFIDRYPLKYLPLLYKLLLLVLFPNQQLLRLICIHWLLCISSNRGNGAIFKCNPMTSLFALENLCFEQECEVLRLSVAGMQVQNLDYIGETQTVNEKLLRVQQWSNGYLSWSYLKPQTNHLCHRRILKGVRGVIWGVLQCPLMHLSFAKAPGVHFCYF